MTERATSRIRQLYASRLLLVALLVAVPFIVYSNNYRHAYHLDDAYTLVTNPSVRTLSAIPRYFVDPATYTSVREQADYRPLLQVSYALNYAMGGYDSASWHFTQILLHALVTLGMYALCRRVLALMRDPPPRPERIAFLAALIFAIHPAASGVVNYLNARSSLLTAAFILPALLAYMRHADDAQGYARPQWRTALFHALALFTKVEAVGALGALWAFDLWQRGREAPQDGFLRSLRGSFDRRTLVRLAPALAVTALYFVIRWRVMSPFPFEDTRHSADVGAYEYFLTQLTAWWHYVARWVAPVRLVADNLAYPVYRTWSHPVVLLAFAAWALVAALLIAAWRRAPYLVFLAIAALALLSPTSSIAALAEMVNEHRPYLPIGVLSLALVIPAGALLGKWPPPSQSGARAAVAGGLALMLVALSTLTYRRNEVFATSDSYWRDVLAKAPSARAHLNLGVSLMAANDLAGAMRQLEKSLEIAPYWYFTHINLGVAYRRLGQNDRAREHFNRAVEYDRYSGNALAWRGEFNLALGEYTAARGDFLLAQPLNLDQYRLSKGLASAYAGMGDARQSLEHTDRMLAIDRNAAVRDIPSVAQPFFAQPNLRAAGLEYYQGLQSRLPASEGSWIAAGIARLSTPSPDHRTQEALMALGLELLRRSDPAGAEAKFREILSLNPNHYGATYQLAVALDRSGKSEEARQLWGRVLRMADGYRDVETARTARARMNAKSEAPR